MDTSIKKDTLIMENYVPTHNLLPIHHIIKGHLVIFHHSNNKLCPQSIEGLSLQIMESIESFLKKSDKL